MPITAEDRARQTIDRLLTNVGWLIQSRNETNINAACGAAIHSDLCSPQVPPKCRFSPLPQ